MSDDVPFAQANADAFNEGAFNSDGSRKPATYMGHVDDHLTAEIEQYLRRAIVCSFIGAEEAFGGSHQHQEDLISDKKLDMLYKEERLLLGNLPNSRTMMVGLSPRRREKTIKYIREVGWLTRKQSSLRELARVHGLLQLICDIFCGAKHNC